MSVVLYVVIQTKTIIYGYNADKKKVNSDILPAGFDLLADAAHFLKGICSLVHFVKAIFLVISIVGYYISLKRGQSRLHIMICIWS